MEIWTEECVNSHYPHRPWFRITSKDRFPVESMMARKPLQMSFIIIYLTWWRTWAQRRRMWLRAWSCYLFVCRKHMMDLIALPCQVRSCAGQDTQLSEQRIQAEWDSLEVPKSSMATFWVYQNSMCIIVLLKMIRRKAQIHIGNNVYWIIDLIIFILGTIIFMDMRFVQNSEAMFV